MSIPKIVGTELAGHAGLPLLVVGPSLGTSPAALWGEAARLLGDDLHVVGWSLPGHDGAPVGEPFTVAELAAGVLAWADGVLEARGSHTPFAYAGDSVGGAVGLQLLLDAPTRVRTAALLCTGARIGTEEMWRDRAATVRASGTPSQVTGSTQRWFAPGFVERQPAVATALLTVLQHTAAEGYAQICEALASFDVRDRLAQIATPVLAVAGADDLPTPAAGLSLIAERVRHGRLVVLEDVAHLAPAEAPARVAELIRAHATGTGTVSAPATCSADHPADDPHDDPYDAGMAVRRAVLGDAHVDRAASATTEITADFQDLITRYAWGSIWTRPGLAPRDRSIAVLTALVAGRHFDELEFHLRAALRNGLTREEIVEVLLQSAIYVGVPAANSAFAVANRVLGE